MLDDDFPDDQKCPYYTEQQMLDKLETPLPVDQAIPALMKVENRAGLISLTDGRTILAKRLSYASTDDEIAAYEAIDPHGNHVIFTTAQVEEVDPIILGVGCQGIPLQVNAGTGENRDLRQSYRSSKWMCSCCSCKS